ncbi:MAG: hypothetical protein B7Y99_02435 [Caulobacterales bacterium 32-69-10]|nr:MAG: hypothetical protein B7Y99_02435 [Caulobacterales bacterium 32-69-10]
MRTPLSASLLSALALLAAAPAAMAADAAPAPEPAPAPRFEIMGPATCKEWPKSGAITSAGKAVPLNWTLGFLSGWAALGRLQLLDVIDAEAVDAWMTDYCAANPTVTLPLAARELERALEAKLPAAAPPPPPVAETPAPAEKPKAPATRRPAPRRSR